MTLTRHELDQRFVQLSIEHGTALAEIAAQMKLTPEELVRDFALEIQAGELMRGLSAGRPAAFQIWVHTSEPPPFNWRGFS